MKKDKQLDYLKVVLLGQLTIEAIEDLQGTNKYRQNIKNQGKQVSKYVRGICTRRLQYCLPKQPGDDHKRIKKDYNVNG